MQVVRKYDGNIQVTFSEDEAEKFIDDIDDLHTLVALELDMKDQWPERLHQLFVFLHNVCHHGEVNLSKDIT